jgi:integrase
MRRREKGVIRERSWRSKKIIWYYREGQGPRTRLPGEYGSPEFNAALKVARGYAVAEVAKPGLSFDDPNSFAGLVDRFCRSAAHLGKSEATQKARRNLFLRVVKRDDGKVGSTPFRAITAKDIRSLHEKIATEDYAVPLEKIGKDDPAGNILGKVPMANGTVAALRVLFQWAVDVEKSIDHNPCLGVKGVKYIHGNNYVWTQEDMDAFEAAYPLGTRERLAYALLLYTGQRSNDVKRMGRHAVVADKGIDWLVTPRQRKTGKSAQVPMLDILKEAIAAAPVGLQTFLVDDRGLPFEGESFGKWFRAACDRANVPDCTAHGLRAAGATRLASRGCSAPTLCGIYGFTIQQAETYIKTADMRRSIERDIHLLNHAA